MGNSTHKECVDSGFLMTRPERIIITPSNVNSLKEGDHIIWKRPYLIRHHMIVIKTFSSGLIEVRHFAPDKTRLKAKAIIKTKVIDPLKENCLLYRINYSSIPGGNSAELVVARTRLGREIENIPGTHAYCSNTTTEPIEAQRMTIERCVCGKKKFYEYRNNDNNLLGVICKSCGQEWLKETKNTLQIIIFQEQTMGKYTPMRWYFMSKSQRTPITTPENVESLEKGDHIAWHRTYFIWHHAIVVKTFSSELIEICHFDSDNKKERKKAIIKTKEIFPLKENGELYKINYSNIPEENSAELVVARTKYLLLQSAKGKYCYNLCLKNCEHFATLCRTGLGVSCQFEGFTSRVHFTTFCLHVLIPIESANGAVTYVAQSLDEVLTCYKDIGEINSKGGISDEDRSLEKTKRISGCVGGVLIVVVGSFAKGNLTRSNMVNLIGMKLGILAGDVVGTWVGGRIATRRKLKKLV